VRLGVNVPNFGPGTEPGVLRCWAQTVEGLGFDLLMISDHIVVTPDVAEQYPAPFYEPFTTLAWLAGITGRVRLGTTVLIVPYRHPLLIARMAANLNDLSGGRLVLGVGAGWAAQEFGALGVPFRQRGKLTDDYLRAVRAAWCRGSHCGWPKRRSPAPGASPARERSTRSSTTSHSCVCSAPTPSCSIRSAVIRTKHVAQRRPGRRSRPSGHEHAT
jgi:alkanesulfonate monooxygenase SsuD/methylene tetrahydromethanopterin reductase-like flavin-dependent oxidoreductase (luciferase family)